MKPPCPAAALLLIAGLFALAAVAPALAAEGSVTGIVVDGDGPVVGAVVELQGPALPKIAAVMTDAAGMYRFPKVPDGTYVLRATLADGAPVQINGVMVAGGKETKAPVISLMVETVEVTAAAEPVVQKDTTRVGESFQADQLQEVPAARDYTSVLKIAPGVSADDGSGGTAAYGSTGLESSYIIDGVNTTSVETGRPAAAVNFDLIDKIDLKTAGYEAEFGGSQGAIVNVTTKSGTNEFAGSFSAYYSPDSLVAAPQTNGFGTTLPVPQATEVAGTVGGPIVKDKVFFFAGVSMSSKTATAPQANLQSVFGDLYRGASRAVAQDVDRTDLYSFKLTAQVTPSNRLTASLFADPRTSDYRDELGGYGGDFRISTGGPTASIQWNSIVSNRWLLDAQIGTHSESSDTTPTEDRQAANPIGADRRYSYQSFRFRGARALSGASLPGEPSLKYGPYAFSGNNDGARRFARISAEGSLGAHIPKFGAEFERNRFDQHLDYGWGTGMALEWSDVTPRGTDGNPLPGTTNQQLVGVRRCWGDGQGACLDWNHQIADKATLQAVKVFAQDSWRPGEDITVNYGVRWEMQDVLDDGGSRLARIKDMIAPRIGFTWDVIGGGRSKLYFSAGRFYDTPPMQVMSRAFSPRILMTRLYRTQNWGDIPSFINSFNAQPGSYNGGLCTANSAGNDYLSCWDFESADFAVDPTKTGVLADKVHSPDGLVNGNFPISFKPEVIVNSGSMYRAPIDRNLKGASTDEAVLGFTWEFKPSWTAGARFIGRRLGNAVEDLSLDYGKNFIIANPGGPYRFYVDPTNKDMVNPNYVPGSADPAQQPGLAQRLGCQAGAICNVGNAELVAAGLTPIPKATRTFRGIELTLVKQVTGNFWLNFSYLHSRTYGNYRGRYFVESEERDPNVTEAFDVPALAVNTTGLLPQDHTHQLKLYGNYRVTPALSLGGTYRYTSGTPRSVTTDPAGGSTPIFGPVYLLQQGANGRNPALSNVDLSLAYDIHDDKKLKMSVYLDVFNALNEQKAVRVDDQFTAVGLPKGVVYPNLGAFITQQGRGEPLDLYVDQVYGNKDGKLTPNEWNAWAVSFQGRFGSLDELYQFLRTATVPGIQSYDKKPVPAYPGFANCPADLASALSNPGSCPGINPGFGLPKELEAPRTVRLGVRLVF